MGVEANLQPGLVMTVHDEEVGLDVTQHGERAYHSDEAGIAIPAGIIEPAPQPGEPEIDRSES